MSNRDKRGSLAARGLNVSLSGGNLYCGRFKYSPNLGLMSLIVECHVLHTGSVELSDKLSDKCLLITNSGHIVLE